MKWKAVSFNVLAVFSIITLAGITICVLSSYRKKKNYDDLLNIALVPCDDIGSQYIVGLSKELNITPSLFHLRLPKENLTTNGSLPYCSLMRCRVTSEDLSDSTVLYDKLKPFIGQRILLAISAIETYRIKKFSKLHTVYNGAPKGYSQVIWLNMEKTAVVLTLQQAIVKAIADKDACVTEQGEQYQPHFTLWEKESVMDIDELAKIKINSLNLRSHPFSMWTKVVVGNSGQNGQMDKIVFEKK